MTVTHLEFVATIGIFVNFLLLTAGYFYHRGRRREPASWEELFGRLVWVDRAAVAEVALKFADQALGSGSGCGDEELEPSQLWRLVGGLDGLEVMERNSEVLIDLAFYVQRSYPEALALAERLRQDARELKWHVGRLKGAAQNGNLQVSFPFYAQRAVVSYYFMTQRLLSLYEAVDLSMLASLQRTL